MAPSETAQAQDKKTKYEKRQERKMKNRRKLKRRGDKAVKKRKDWRRLSRKSRQGDRPFKGNIAGRKVKRIKPSTRSRAVHPQPNPYAGRSRRSEAARAKAFKKNIRYSKKPHERAWKGDVTGSKIRHKNFRSQRRRLVPQTSPYLRKRRTGERDGARFAGQGFKGIRSVSGRSKDALKKKRITPRSASGAYTVRKRKKPYAWRERSKWEEAYQGDITGRTFKTKRTTDRPGIKPRPKVKYSFQGKGRRGDKAYDGTMTSGYRSATSGKERAWKGNISGHKLRKRTSRGAKFDGANFKTYPNRKFKRNEKAYKKPVPVKPPGPGAERAVKFQGNIKSRKPLKGAGGSISGRWNNKGKPIEGRGIKDQDQRMAGFQGNIKSRRPVKGAGGSISGRTWNNKGKPVEGRGIKDQDQRTADFQGNIKARRPVKGAGGSISGRRWNNKGKPVEGRGMKDQDQRIAGFQGNIKINRGRKDQDKQIAGHTGNIRQWKYNTGPLDQHKYEGRLKRKQEYRKNPNAAEKALKVKPPSGSYREAAKFTGNIRQWKYKTGPLDQHKYEGRFKRKQDYKKNPNAAEKALKAKAPAGSDRQAAKFTGNIRQWKYKTGPLDEMKYEGQLKRRGKYKRNPNAAEEALIVKKPKKAASKGLQFEGRFKRKGKYKQNPNAVDEALVTKAPGKGTRKGYDFSGRFKMTANYERNKLASQESLKGIGPSKAAVKANQYQGNLKMKKGKVVDTHPSFKFDKKPQDNPIEKTKFSLKLLWSRLFKKNENQPQHLKEKKRKPRYDKGEEGLWNE
ncbi:MAG: hypothetical protein R3345_06560 [Fulvivirga sp.]|nr:hypothetical protein [Fulvivirga sp.]